MKRKYVVLLAVVGAVAAGIFASALVGRLPANDVPFALGVLAVFSALWFGYLTLRIRDE